MREYGTVREAIVQVGKEVLTHGRLVKPRDQATREIVGMQFAVLDPTDSLPVGIGRMASIPMAAVEAVQLVGGFSDPWLVRQINPTMSRFFELHGGDPDQVYQHGAYGPRVAEPMKQVERLLKADRDTRQALLTIWSPRRDYRSSPDIPCTVSLQFLIRSDRLILLVYMRSNDVWWGLTYDGFQFTQLQLALANCLGVEPGTYVHTAGSMHVYLRDADRVENLHLPTTRGSMVGALGAPGSFERAQSRAMLLARAAKVNDPIPFVEPTDTEVWYHKQLQYRSPRDE